MSQETQDKPKTVPERLDGLFAPWNRSDAPGLAVGVAKDGRVLYRRGFGMASLESRTAMAPSTRLRIGSTSKHFTALLALLLQEEGKFDLDAPIRTYLPELTGPGGEPSARLLLQHRGGSRCYLDLGFLTRGMTSAPVGESLKAQARQGGRNFAAGESMIYNNGGYHLVSIAIERAGGVPFEDQLKTRLFEAVGMVDTISLPSDFIILPGMAAMHLPAPGGGWRRGLFPSEEVRGEGAIVSTIDDMLRWMAHLRRRDLFGQADSWRQLTERPAYADGRQGAYALGLMVDTYRGRPTLHHAGGVIGGTAQMLTLPDDGLDVIILVNGAPAANAVRLAEQVADIVLADRLEPEAGRPQSEAWPVLIGRWWSPDAGITYDFLDEKGELKSALNGAPIGGNLTLRDGQLVTPPGGIGEIAIDPTHAKEGEITVSFGGRFFVCRKVVEAEKLDPAFVAAIEGGYSSADADGTASIRLDGEKLIARFSDPFGCVDVTLRQLGVALAGTGLSAAGSPHFATLAFAMGDGIATGFTLNSARTRNLVFERA
ncbi:MAG TPA: serine hydrolase domain-containing protein [Caulobacteraceae bacterium]|jgi:CubicO group peptidase (beta-lactamase class C family)